MKNIDKDVCAVCDVTGRTDSPGHQAHKQNVLHFGLLRPSQTPLNNKI